MASSVLLILDTPLRARSSYRRRCGRRFNRSSQETPSANNKATGTAAKRCSKVAADCGCGRGKDVLIILHIFRKKIQENICPKGDRPGGTEGEV